MLKISSDILCGWTPRQTSTHACTYVAWGDVAVDDPTNLTMLKYNRDTVMLEKSASTLIVLIVRAVFPSHYFGAH